MNLEKLSTDALLEKREKIIDQIGDIATMQAYASQGKNLTGTSTKLKRLYARIEPINDLLYNRLGLDRKKHAL